MLLPYDAKVVVDLASELDRWKTQLDYRGPIPRAWAGRLRRDLEAEAVAASTSMAGVLVTVEEVHRILAGDRPPETSEEDTALVRGYRDAMSFVLRRADDAAFRWDRGLLTGLHDRILAGNWGAGAGRFRTSPAYVVDNRTGELVFQPPPPDDVPGLVDSACSVIQQGLEHPAIGAAWTHAAVAAIHPFKDGNGRASRVVASLATYRGGFKLPEFTSLEEWWGRHLSDYYARFRCLGETFDPNADVTPFIRAHMEAQLHQVRALDLRERVQQRIWTAVEEAVSGAGGASPLATIDRLPTSAQRQRRMTSLRLSRPVSFARKAKPDHGRITPETASIRASGRRSRCKATSLETREERSSLGSSRSASLQRDRSRPLAHVVRLAA